MKKNPKHLAIVGKMECILADKWRHECEGKTDCHHPIGVEWRGMSQKADDDYVIPLCHSGHHQFGKHAIHQMGRRPWESKYGTQRELLEKTRRLMECDYAEEGLQLPARFYG